MATPLNELQSNPENNDMHMDDSNSQIVNEILNEMGGDNPTSQVDNQQQMYINDQENQINRQIDPNVNMLSSDNLENMALNDDLDLNDTVINVSTKTKTETLLEKLKDPLFILGISFFINSPLVKKLLSSYLPKLFSDGVSPVVSWISVLVKSIIISVSFFAFKMLV